jgi:xanthine dehydrogenase YagS FAD-binding subunit
LSPQTPDARELERAAAWLSRNLGPWGEEFYAARSLEEAVGLLGGYGRQARVIAGGVDVLSLIKSRNFQPQTLISLRNTPGLRYVQEGAEGLSLGPTTRIADLLKSSEIQSRFPALAAAAASIGSPQVRNMGTLAGDLCQEVRCWYYRRSPDTGISYPCLRKTGTGPCFAREGENQYHAILPSEGCCAICPSDLATVLAALDAQVKVVGAGGERSLPVADLYSAVGLALGRDELIRAVEIPPARPGERQEFLKFRLRKALDFAVVSIAVRLKMAEDKVAEARIVLGGVTFKPVRLLEAEQTVTGRRLGESLAIAAAATFRARAVPLSQNGYKLTIAETLIKRALVGSKSDL